MVRSVIVASVVGVVACGASVCSAQTLSAGFADKYSLTNLGSITNIPTNYGCIIFKDGDPNTLLVGGAANNAAGALYATQVIRDADQHIVGFSPAVRFCDAPNNDGGIARMPNGVLMISMYSNNAVAQVKPGQTTVARTINLAPLGVGASPGGVSLVPDGYPGAGRLKISGYASGTWYDVPYSLAADGTYDLGTAVQSGDLSVTVEGYVYVPRCSPNFFAPSILLCEYGAGSVSAYVLDDNGSPINATRRTMVTGLSGAEGAVIDPVTGDFLFGTYGGGNRIVRVTGFAAPPKCAVDFNEDCFLDFTDFDLFVENFEAGTAKADFTGDGFITFEDFDAFVQALERGGC